MSLKDDAIELTVAAVATLAVLWYVERKISGAASSVGDALSSAWGTVSSLPGQVAGAVGDAAGAVGSAYANGGTPVADAYGTLAQGNSDLFGSGATVGTVSPWGSLGDTVSSWFGGSSSSTSSTSSDTSTPVFPIDYGTGANDWSS